MAGFFLQGGAVGAIGAGVGVAAAVQAGKAAETEAESQRTLALFNARVQERRAEEERTRAKFAQQRQAEEAARAKSALRARIAKAGGLGSPVAEDLAAEEAEESDLENLLIGFEGEARARLALSQADIDRFNAKLARQRGKTAVRASRIQAGASLLQGFGGGF